MEQRFKATIVWLILRGETERATEMLARRYNVNPPIIKVGLPKRHKSKTLGCYDGKKKTIAVLDSDALKNPFVIIHEFYHHLRTNQEKHRGTEKYANAFAAHYLEAYKSMTTQTAENGKRKKDPNPQSTQR